MISAHARIRLLRASDKARQSHRAVQEEASQRDRAWALVVSKQPLKRAAGDALSMGHATRSLSNERTATTQFATGSLGDERLRLPSQGHLPPHPAWLVAAMARQRLLQCVPRKARGFAEAAQACAPKPLQRTWARLAVLAVVLDRRGDKGDVEPVLGGGGEEEALACEMCGLRVRQARHVPARVAPARKHWPREIRT